MTMCGRERGDERERVKKKEVEDKIESDHQPISVWVEGGGKRERKEGVRRRVKKWYLDGRGKIEV